MNNIINEQIKKMKELQSRRDGSFIRNYDSLAFPGGLEKELSLLKKHDPKAIELAIQFLESDPWFFRSGYIKESITRYLKKAPLSNNQISRLHKVILDMFNINERRREFRHYCRLAKAIQTPELVAEIQKMTKGNDPLMAYRANIALKIINS